MDRILCRLLIAIYSTGIISSGYDRFISAHALPSGSNKFLTKALEQMDKYLEVYNKSCNSIEPSRPNFKDKGLRISETKCLDYIWDTKYDEAQQKFNQKCLEYRISDGVPAEPGEYPHMAAIGWKNVSNSKWVFKCGGSLISELFVLTAAHCERDNNETQPEIVRLGVVNIQNEKLIEDGYGVDRKINEFKKHPKYRSGFKNYDVALIKLEEKVRFSHSIQPACMLKQNGIEETIVTGWGAFSNDNIEMKSDNLLEAEVYILKNKECKKKWSQKRFHWKYFFTGGQICAVGVNNTDVCAGDSGGPLQTKLPINTNKSIHNIVGVVAFNYACGSHNFPSVYTRLHYRTIINWIEREVWGREQNKI